MSGEFVIYFLYAVPNSLLVFVPPWNMLLARVFVLSLHSKRKGDLGYYSAHRTGGYKDGLNDGEFSMKGPKKLDENRARTIRNRGGTNPSLHSAKNPENAGTRLLKYTWEDDVCVVRIFVDHIPESKSWAEADISSKGISGRWEDRESILLLLADCESSSKVKRLEALSPSPWSVTSEE